MHPFLPQKLESTTSGLVNFVNALKKKTFNIKTKFEGEIDPEFKITWEESFEAKRLRVFQCICIVFICSSNP